MARELYSLTIHALSALLQARTVSAAEALESVIARIEALDGRINAYISRTFDRARQQAEAADRRLARGDAGPLTGVPLAIKDILCTESVRTTCGSRMLENFVPPYDATVVARLKACGAVFTGKTSMDEFAMGSSNETAFSGAVHNPWDLERVPGGSSGGSAAAVAADECIAALGTDTGGSIRQPASLCGVVGLKPTYGRVSRFGLIAFASSLDQVGPITKDVEDAAILLSCISGHDPKDSTSIRREVPDYERALKKDVQGLRIGIPKEYFIDGLDPQVEKAVRDAIGILKSQGAEIVEVSLPHTEYAVAVYYLIAPAEACSNLARYDGVKYGYRSPQPGNLRDMYEQSRSEGFGPEVKRRIMLGTYALSAGYYDAYYKKASQVRTLIRRDFMEAFSACDLIVTPTAPAPAFKLREKLSDPLSMYLSDIFTIPTNLAGLPGISLPCGFSKDGLPIGLQIIGNLFAEEQVLHCAYCYEQSTQWHRRKPSLA
jgi:aspartyl-tRNA(Asn)/glutamyl-tRNA(Gln) amidotransferase subunit A